MARYYFDIYNSDTTYDDVGHDLPNIGAVRKMAMNSLPKIAADEIPDDGDKRNFVVVARDEEDRIVYTATLSYVGLAFRAALREASFIGFAGFSNALLPPKCARRCSLAHSRYGVVLLERRSPV